MSLVPPPRRSFHFWTAHLSITFCGDFVERTRKRWRRSLTTKRGPSSIKKLFLWENQNFFQSSVVQQLQQMSSSSSSLLLFLLKVISFLINKWNKCIKKFSFFSLIEVVGRAGGGRSWIIFTKIIFLIKKKERESQRL